MDLTQVTGSLLEGQQSPKSTSATARASLLTGVPCNDHPLGSLMLIGNCEGRPTQKDKDNRLARRRNRVEQPPLDAGQADVDPVPLPLGTGKPIPLPPPGGCSDPGP